MTQVRPTNVGMSNFLKADKHAKIFKQYDIQVDEETTIKELKENLVQNISSYSKLAEEYQQKLSHLLVFLNRLEFQESLRNIQDLQELFSYCRDKLQLSEKHIQIEQDYYSKKREQEIKNIELSQLKNKVKKQEEFIKHLDQENNDLRSKIVTCMDDNTALQKHQVQDQSKLKHMVYKCEGLEQGLLSLSDTTKSDPTELRQSRLKTTIHLLIMENNTLKKELSYMKNQNDEQEKEVLRLKKKINHLVMKIDSQNRALVQKKRRFGGTTFDLQIQENPVDLMSDSREMEKANLEEFEKVVGGNEPLEMKIDDISKLQKTLSEEIPSPLYTQQQSEQASPMRSNFNLQGPYWKNRTNEILKQDRDKRKLNKFDIYDSNQPFIFPSLLAQEGRDKRMQHDFRGIFMSEDESNILKEIQQLGVPNYIETTMSLRSLEIKKNLEIVAREYTINNLIRSVYEFLNGEIIDYFINGKGDIGKMIIKINNSLTKVLDVKEFKVWVRDIMNNYLWTYNSDNLYTTFNLSLSDIGQQVINQKVPMLLNFQDQQSLIVPMVNQSDLNMGVVQIVGDKDKKSLESYTYEQQIIATIVSENMIGLMVKEQNSKFQYYILGKQQHIQHCISSIITARTTHELYQLLNTGLQAIFGLEKIKIALMGSDMNLWNYQTNESGENVFQQFNPENIQSLMTQTIKKNHSLIFFMPYQSINFDQRLDMDTSLPLNSILIKTSRGKIIGVVQFENKQIKNRNEMETKLQNQMVIPLTDEAILHLISQISEVLSYCLEKVSLPLKQH